jgi:hypothetical protein
MTAGGATKAGSEPLTLFGHQARAKTGYRMVTTKAAIARTNRKSAIVKPRIGERIVFMVPYATFYNGIIGRAASGFRRREEGPTKPGLRV